MEKSDDPSPLISASIAYPMQTDSGIGHALVFVPGKIQAVGYEDVTYTHPKRSVRDADRQTKPTSDEPASGDPQAPCFRNADPFAAVGFCFFRRASETRARQSAAGTFPIGFLPRHGRFDPLHRARLDED